MNDRLSTWMWLGAIAVLVIDLGLQVFGAKPEIVEGVWRSAVVFMLTAIGQQIRERNP